MQTQLRKFNKYMSKIEKMNSKAFQWLTEISVDKSVRKSGMVHV